MKTGLFTVSARLGGQLDLGREIHSNAREILSEISQKLKISELITTPRSAEEITENFKGEIDGAIILVATGGTDNLVRSISTKLEKPTMIVAYPSNNSLPASLEAFAALKEDNIPVKITYTELDSTLVNKVKTFSRVCESISKLEKSRLGLVGKEEPWILMSKDEGLIRERIGPELKRFELSELLKSAEEMNSKKAREIANELKSKFGEVVEPGDEEFTRAAEIYLAMKELISNHDLSAIAVSHDLIKRGVIGCIGASLCNDEGIPAGYEVDPLAMLTMMIVSFISGEPCWMANPVRIDKDSNELTLAHCEVPMEMLDGLDNSALRSYFDSRRDESVAIQGPLEKRDVTIARLGGPELNKMQIVRGRIVKSNMKDPDLCRTQAVVKLGGDIEEFILESLGNHHILAYGDLTSELRSFCNFKGIEPILIE